MYFKERKDSYFLDMIEDKNFALYCLDFVSSYNYTSEEMIILKDNLLNAKKSFERMLKVKKLLSFFKIKKIDDRITFILKNKTKEIKRFNSCLENFEAELAYMVINNMLNGDEIKKLGFSEEYIDNLIYKYKCMLENAFVEYYYDETNDITYIKNNSGWEKLDEKPSVVTDYLENSVFGKDKIKVLSN